MNSIAIIVTLFEALGVILVGGLVLLASMLVIFFAAHIVRAFVKSIKITEKTEDKKNA